MAALANVALTDTFDTWRVRTNQLIVYSDQTNTYATSALTRGILGSDQANTAYQLTNTKIGSVTSNGSGRIWANNTTDGSNNKLVFLDLALSGVAAGTYGGSSAIPIVTVDGYGRTTSVSTASVTSMDYAYAAAVGVSANAYALSISSSGSSGIAASVNAWANSVGTAGNNYTNSVGAAGNNYTNAVGAAGNNYMLSVTSSGNTFARVFANSTANASNSYAGTVGISSNLYSISTSQSYAAAVGVSANAYAASYGASVGVAANNYTSATYLKIVGGQTLSGGFNSNPYALGSSSFTVNPLLGNYQYITLTSSIIIYAPASACAVDIMVTNGAGAGLSFSGFQDTSGNYGDPYYNTNGYKYLVMIRRINFISTYSIKSMQ